MPPAPASPAWTRPPSLTEYVGEWNDMTAMHLLRRTLIAPTVAEMRAVRALTMKDVVGRLVAPTPALPDPPPYVGAWMLAATKYYDTDRADMTRVFSDELRRWWYTLMINAGLSVRERMTLFWHNHFPTDITIPLDARFYYIQHQLFRQFAVGDFKALVRAVTIDKAMLWYLDGKANKKGKELNENYARELQELFTIGVTDNNGAANYTQQDVHEAARVLSGWGFNGDGITGDVSCPPWFGHDPTDKIVYGRVIAGREYGEGELDDLLDIIFDREETARYILRKLYRFFVYTDAPLTPVAHLDDVIEQNIIAPLAAEFRQNNWDISRALGRLLSSDHFYDPALVGAQIKSPTDLMVGTIRAMTPESAAPAGDTMLQYLHNCCASLGQTLLRPPGVQGWQFHRSWISSTTLPQRHSFTDAIIDGASAEFTIVEGALDDAPTSVAGTTAVDVLAYAKQFAAFAEDPNTLVADIASHLLAFPPSERLLAQLRTALLEGQPAYEWADLDDDLRRRRLCGMMKFLMRSANYQLM